MYYDAAHIRRDERVLLEIDLQDLWAKDIPLHHRSCHLAYVSPRALEQKMDKNLVVDGCAENAMAFEKASDLLAEYIT